MKKAVGVLIAFNLLMIALIILALSSKVLVSISFTLVAICFGAIRLSWIAFIVWFLWPYIKRGINYLVDHRND